MPTPYEEASRLSEFGIVVLPVPPECAGPSFDWTIFRFQKPTADQIWDWFSEGDVGLGVVCGQVSGNLVALEFTLPDSYRLWASRNPRLTAKLPTMVAGQSKFVFFRSDKPLGSGALDMPGVNKMVGRLHGEGSFVALPAAGEDLVGRGRWIGSATVLGVGTDGTPENVEHSLDRGQECPRYGGEGGMALPVLSLKEAGVTTRARALPSNAILRRLAEDPIGAPGSAAIVDASKYGTLFDSISEYLEGPEQGELQWIVKDFLPESYLMVFAGTSKAGKGCILTSLCMAVATGQDFLGRPATQGSVLWVAFEESKAERIQTLKLYEDRPAGFYITHQKLHIDTDEGIEALRWWIRKTQARLVVIDPLYGATNMESLADGRSARVALSGLKQLCNAERCAAIVIHHITKNTSIGMTRERFADSNQILAIASMDILMDYQEKADGTREIWLSGRGRGDFANQTWLVRSRGATHFELIASGTEAQMNAYRGDEVIVSAIRSFDKPVTADELASSLGINIHTMRNRLTALAKSGQISHAGKVDRANVYAALGPTPSL